MKAGAFVRAAARRRTLTFEASVVAPAPREVVWELITDWEHQGDWMLEASDFLVTSDVREGAGVEAEATVRIGGIKTRDRVRVVGWEPPRRLVIAHLGWVSGTGEVHLTPLGDSSTHVFWREDLAPPWGALGAIGMTLIRPVITHTFRRDLRVLAALARVAARAHAAGTGTKAAMPKKSPKKPTGRRSVPKASGTPTPERSQRKGT